MSKIDGAEFFLFPREELKLLTKCARWASSRHIECTWVELMVPSRSGERTSKLPDFGLVFGFLTTTHHKIITKSKRQTTKKWDPHSLLSNLHYPLSAMILLPVTALHTATVLYFSSTLLQHTRLRRRSRDKTIQVSSQHHPW